MDRKKPECRYLPVTEIRREFQDTWSYFLSFPDTSDPITTFVPGQYIHLVAPNAPVSKPTVRHMSIASIPEDGHLRLAMSLASRSPYKQAFRRLKPGDTLGVFGVSGTFTLQTLTPGTPLIFIAGGIGITPIMSLIRHIAAGSLDHPWKLLHVANTPLFKNEIADIFPDHPRLYCNRSGIDSSLETLLPSPQPTNQHYFISGSNSFLHALTSRMVARGITPATIHTEDFDH
jgi:ferredoxin-NADP reductase